MWTLLLVFLTTGSPALLNAAPVHGHSGRCRFAGVFHVEGTSSYSLTFQQAQELCQSLDYTLATQEQVIQAYKKGLRTCRYGWIDGQNVTFLPRIDSPNCDSISTEVTFHSEAAEYLSDVYCFNPSDSLDLNCEDGVQSDSETSTSESPVTTIEIPNEDILEEALMEGFLVDVEKEASNTTQDGTSPTKSENESVTLFKDTELDNRKQNLTHYPGQNGETETAVTNLKTFIQPETSEEPSTVTDTENARGPTNKFRFGRSSVVTSDLLTEAEGSGSGLGPWTVFDPKPTQYTTRLFTTEAADDETFQTIQEEVLKEVEMEGPKQETAPKGRSNVHAFHPDAPPTPSGQQVEGTQSWLIIFAFCVVVGAILCLFAAIATKDKWYGPRRSKNLTSEEYTKATTLPLSEKEQEIVKLMNIADIKNDKTEDIKDDCLAEHEREYLM